MVTDGHVCMLLSWRTGGDHQDALVALCCVDKDYPARSKNAITSPWMKQSTWLRIVHSGDWCLRLTLRTPSAACRERRWRSVLMVLTRCNVMVDFAALFIWSVLSAVALWQWLMSMQQQLETVSANCCVLLTRSSSLVLWWRTTSCRWYVPVTRLSCKFCLAEVAVFSWSRPCGLPVTSRSVCVCRCVAHFF